MLVQVCRKLRVLPFMANQHLHPVAGGKDQTLPDSRVRQQRLRLGSQALRSDRQPFAQLNRRGLMVQACEKYFHGALNLWTELNTFAAHTLNIARNTRDDT